MVTVTMYTTGPACMQCRLTAALLQQAGIVATVVDITVEANSPAREYITEELGYSQAPVVVVDGSPHDHWSGFRPDEISRVAARAQAADRALLDTAASSGTVSPHFFRPIRSEGLSSIEAMER